MLGSQESGRPRELGRMQISLAVQRFAPLRLTGASVCISGSGAGVGEAQPAGL